MKNFCFVILFFSATFVFFTLANVTEKKCNPLKIQQDNWRQVLKDAFSTLKSTAGTWNVSPTYRREGRRNEIYFVKGRCVRREECRSCINKLVDASWKECNNAISGMVKNSECSVKWDRTHFNDF